MPLFTSSRPSLRVRVLPRFPAAVLDGPGLSWTRTGAAYQPSLDYTSLEENVSIADPSAYTVAIYNPDSESYEQASLSVLQGAGIDTRASFGNTNYSVLTTDRYVALTATLTAQRTVTLPAANTVPAGRLLTIQDEAGGINGANTLKVQATGADTINGAAFVTIAQVRGGVTLRCDGSSKWSYTALALSASDIADDAITAAKIATDAVGSAEIAADAVTTTEIVNDAVTNAKLANMGSLTLKGAISSGDPADLTPAQLRDSFLPAGSEVDSAYAEYTTSASLSTVIPSDDTVPTSTEGTQILSVGITPKSATNKLRI